MGTINTEAIINVEDLQAAITACLDYRMEVAVEILEEVLEDYYAGLEEEV